MVLSQLTLFLRIQNIGSKMHRLFILCLLKKYLLSVWGCVLYHWLVSFSQSFTVNMAPFVHIFYYINITSLACQYSQKLICRCKSHHGGSSVLPVSGDFMSAYDSKDSAWHFCLVQHWAECILGRYLPTNITKELPFLRSREHGIHILQALAYPKGENLTLSFPYCYGEGVQKERNAIIGSQPSAIPTDQHSLKMVIQKLLLRITKVAQASA